MKIQNITFSILFVLFINYSFAYINISSCTTINEGMLDSSREIRLNQSMNISGSDCIVLNGINNTIIDCQNNKVIGNNFFGTNGIEVSNIKNITIKNCNIEKFYSGLNLYKVYNSKFDNIKAYNNSDTGIYTYIVENITFNNLLCNNNTDDGLLLLRVKYSTITNSYFRNNDYGLSISDINVMYNNFVNLYIYDNNYGFGFWDDGTYNNLTNIHIYNNNYGLWISSDSDYNTIKNSQIYDNSIYELYFDESLWGEANNNTFYSNYLGNISKISSVNWSITPNFFNYSTYGNQYSGISSFTGGFYCFDAPLNQSCDYHPSVYIPTSTSSNNSGSIFPMQNFMSILISTLLIVIYLFI